MSSNRIKLTKTAVAAIAAPSAGQSFTWDTELPCFGVRTSSGGTKTFIVQKRVNGADRRVKLERVGSITVDDARKLARVHLGEIAKGNDPIREKIVRRDAARKERQRNTHTVKYLLKLYCDHLERRGRVTARAVRTDLERNIVRDNPTFARRPAAEIAKSEVSAVLRSISDRGRSRARGKTRAYLHAAYQLAITADSDSDAPKELVEFHITSNPVTGTKPTPIKARDRTLAKAELRSFYRRLAEIEGVAADLVRCSMLLAGQRPTQLARCLVSDFDSDNGLLILRDLKGRRLVPRVHVVPLTGPVLALIQKRIEVARALNTEHLFSSVRGKPASANAASNLVTALARTMLDASESAEHFQLADLRRTAETILASLGVSKDVRAQIQSHGLGGVQSKHYDRYDYLKGKREAIERWQAVLTQSDESAEDPSACLLEA